MWLCCPRITQLGYFVIGLWTPAAPGMVVGLLLMFAHSSMRFFILLAVAGALMRLFTKKRSRRHKVLQAIQCHLYRSPAQSQL
jgi:hypothetical protein